MSAFRIHKWCIMMKTTLRNKYKNDLMTFNQYEFVSKERSSFFAHHYYIMLQSIVVIIITHCKLNRNMIKTNDLGLAWSTEVYGKQVLQIIQYSDDKFRLSQNILQAHLSSKVVITNINCRVLLRKPRGRGTIDAIVIKMC